jgi:ribose/xylose/arabinose/galactoside ABC-type transport system permease subunit
MTALPATRRRLDGRLVAAVLALVLVLAIGAWRNPEFLGAENILNVLRQNAVLMLLAVGMTFVIISGGIDLSVGSILAFTSVVTVKLAPQGLPVAAGAAVLTGLGLGMVNGLLVARLRIAPFIATLVTLLALRGLTLAVFGEETVALTEGRSKILAFGRDFVLGMPVQVPIVAAVLVAAWVLLTQTRFGRAVYAVGGSEDSARLLGIDVAATRFAVYGLSGAIAGLAGFLFAVRIGAGITNYGLGLELDAITAVALGGTLLSGGVGGVAGTAVGVLIVGFLFNLFNLDATLDTFLQKVVRGGLLTVVVVMQGTILQRRRK